MTGVAVRTITDERFAWSIRRIFCGYSYNHLCDGIEGAIVALIHPDNMGG